MVANTKKIDRKDLKPGESLCEYCTAKCCRYFALPIDAPDTRTEYDYIRWYMIHGRVSIFVDDETWYVMVHADCEHLQPDYRCGIYEKRPQICRDYTTDECEYDDDACYDKFFETSEQLWEYIEAIFPQQKRPRSNRDVSLPVLSAAAG